MKRLNRDVILHICPYLDPGTLVNLAEVYPHLISEISRVFKGRVSAFKLAGSATTSAQVEEILGSMTTSFLDVKYENRTEGRKVPERVSLNPGAIVRIRQQYCDYEVDAEATESQIPPPKLVNCDFDLQGYFAIIKEYIRDFLKSRSGQKRCEIHASPKLLRAIFESIAGDGEHIIVDGSRQVRLVHPQALLYLLFEQSNQL
ncbi:hypothetical protein Aduo_000130 [Ancylostoma duodenale]